MRTRDDRLARGVGRRPRLQQLRRTDRLRRPRAGVVQRRPRRRHHASSTPPTSTAGPRARSSSGPALGDAATRSSSPPSSACRSTPSAKGPSPPMCTAPSRPVSGVSAPNTSTSTSCTRRTPTRRSPTPSARSTECVAAGQGPRDRLLELHRGAAARGGGGGCRHGAAHFVSVQNEYSLLHREPERDVLPECERTGVSFLPYFPLASGVLTGKYQRGEPPPPGHTPVGSERGPHRGPLADDQPRRRGAAEPPSPNATGGRTVELAIAWIRGARAGGVGHRRRHLPGQVHANVAAAGLGARRRRARRGRRHRAARRREPGPGVAPGHETGSGAPGDGDLDRRPRRRPAGVVTLGLIGVAPRRSAPPAPRTRCPRRGTRRSAAAAPERAWARARAQPHSSA